MIRWIGIGGVLLCLDGGIAAAQAPTQAPSEQPQIYLTPRPAILVPGWPLVVDVEVVHAERGGADGVRDTVLASGWHRHIRLDAWRRPRESLRGKSRPPLLGWPFKPATDNSERLVVSRRGMPAGRRVVHFVLSPEETSKLQPGAYQLQVELDPRSVEGGGGSWRVEVSYSTQLAVKEAPTEVSPSMACDAVHAQTNYLVAKGDVRRAIAVLDEFLVKNAATANALCWGSRGQLSERQGMLQEAVEYYRKANRAFQRDYRPSNNPDSAMESPYQLHCMQLIDTLAGRETRRSEAISPIAEKILPEKILGRPRRDTCD
ncbi:hypothetical protein MYSTI_05726 [Myxococcus stipitatus DSM 14675]|uniref:Tetratricopeptide repeat protein n=1 Tax=Myxococcus stipitatus (strain DSM 14675 / JCM 12634 / Mx s8) TaxID=1278073 RepID=L7UHH4_MYXSD|nr:hypothetical protein MYSTI_05726 [Myxococcus stipitatus DSM 14675]